MDVRVGQTKDKNDPAPQLTSDYWVFVNLMYTYPRCFIFTKEELQAYVCSDNNPGKEGKWSWWLESKVIYNEKSMDTWDKIKV